MIISLNYGHTLKGVGGGAVGYLIESQETRTLGNKVYELLKKQGHTVYLHNVDTAKTVTESLKGITDKVNISDAELFVSIHFNAFDKKAKGTEVYTYEGLTNTNKNYVPQTCGKIFLDEMSKLGFKSRGIKKGANLYVIKNTVPKAMLLEVCFVDNKEDAERYKNNVDNIAKAIVKAITGEEVKETVTFLNEFDEAKRVMKQIGVTDGTRPKDNVTREEVFTMLYRLYNKLK